MKLFLHRLIRTTALPVIPAFLAAMIFAGCAGEPESVEPVIQEAAVQYDNVLSPEAEELLRTGIGYHDRGDYETALDYYNQAMELAPDHPIIYYEIGYTRHSMGECETALEMAEKGIAEAKKRDYTEVIPTLMDLKGSALDDLNRSEDAIAVYLEAINGYDAANTFLYYNLAVSYYRLERRAEAIDALTKGLLINPNHASSNYLLGILSVEGGKKTQGFYALCYFLLLEPDTDRAGQSYNTILDMLEPWDAAENGTFTQADTVIAGAFALDEQNAALSDAEKIREKLKYIMTNLEELKNSGAIERAEGDELYWNFYAPFMYRIAGSDYFNTFARYIGLYADPEADDWIENGRDEIEGFFEWLNAYSE